MAKIKYIYDKVERALRDFPQLQEDDLALTLHIYSEILNKDASTIKFGNICSLIKTKELPPVDSVRRARCKAQELYPELIHKPTQEKRLEEIPEYKDFARMGK